MVKRYRPFWLSVHKYVGLVLGVLIAVISGTGAIAVYKAEIEGALNPELHYVEPLANTASPTEIIGAATAAYPDWRPTRVVPNDGYPDRAYQIYLSKSGETPIRVFVNPYTLDVLGTHEGWRFLQIIIGLHVELLLGDNGKYVVGSVSIAMLATLVVGVILWWPSKTTWKRAFTLSWKFGLERFMRDLHNVSGFYLLIVMFLLTFSGTAIIFPNATTAALKLVIPGETLSLQRRPQSQPLPSGQSIDINEALEAANSVAAGNHIKGILSPFGPRGVYLVLTAPPGPLVQAPAKAIRIDQYSGEILAGPNDNPQSNVDRFMDGWADPIHTGAAFGEIGRLLAFVGGMALPILFGSGTYMWYRRRQRS